MCCAGIINLNWWKISLLLEARFALVATVMPNAIPSLQLAIYELIARQATMPRILHLRHRIIPHRCSTSHRRYLYLHSLSTTFQEHRQLRHHGRFHLFPHRVYIYQPQKQCHRCNLYNTIPPKMNKVMEMDLKSCYRCSFNLIWTLIMLEMKWTTSSTHLQG